MQTFAPYVDMQRTVRTLDYRRLGKQRVEAKQILQILRNETTTKGWRSHPAVKMWTGYEGGLAAYGYMICEEWIRRGYKDSLLPYFGARLYCVEHAPIFVSTEWPEWWGNAKFHRSHRSNLLRKDPIYYGKMFKREKSLVPTLDYIWPVQ